LDEQHGVSATEKPEHLLRLWQAAPLLPPNLVPLNSRSSQWRTYLVIRRGSSASHLSLYFV